MTQNPKRLSYDLASACEATGLGRDTLTRAINTGALRARKTGEKLDEQGNKVATGKFIILAADLESWLNELPAA